MRELLRIYRADGTPFNPGGHGQVEVTEFQYTAERMGPESLSATVRHPMCLDDEWQGGEYVELRGRRFVLRGTPSSQKDNTDSRYVHTLSFLSRRDAVLSNVYFYDIVEPSAADGSFQSGMSRVWFHGTLQEFVSRVSAVLSYRGLPYSVRCDSGVSATERKFVSFENKTIFEVLQEAYTQWEVPFHFDGDTCVYGIADEYIPEGRFAYGHDQRLVSMARNAQESAVITRISGHGSDQNIPYYYPNPTAKGVVGVESEGSLPASAYHIRNAVRFCDSIPTGERITFEEDRVGFTLNKTLPDEKYYSPMGHNVFSFWDLGHVTRGILLRLAFRYKPERDEDFTPDLRVDLSDVSCDGAGMSAGYYHDALRESDYVTVDYVQLNFNDPEDPTVIGEMNREGIVTRSIVQKSTGKVNPPYQMLEVKTMDHVDMTFGTRHLRAGVSYTFEFLVSLTAPVPLYTFIPSGSTKGSDPVNLRGRVNVILRNRGSFYCWTRPSGAVVRPERIGLVIDGEPQPGDVFWQTATGRRDVSAYLMPSIWRKTQGKERFYNAVSEGYEQDGVQVGPWGCTFTNEYDPSFPREFIQDFDDVKPTIVGHLNAAGEAVNAVLDAYYESGYDPALLVEGSDERRFSRFFVKLRRTDGVHPFNLFDCAIDEDGMSLSMTSGRCGGCEFKVLVDELNQNRFQVREDGSLDIDENTGLVRVGPAQARQNDTENNEVWIGLQVDASTYGGDISDEFIMPSRDFRVGSGDEFVILHILLPEAYILEAEDELERRLVNYMAENNDEKWSFTMKLSRIWLAQHPEVAARLGCDSAVMASYNGVDLPKLYVTSYSYRVTSAEALPEVTIDLKDVIEVSGNSLERKIKGVITDTIRISQAVTGADSLGSLPNVDGSADGFAEEPVVLTKSADSTRWTPSTLESTFGVSREAMRSMVERLQDLEGAGSEHWKGFVRNESELPDSTEAGDMYAFEEDGQVDGVPVPAGTVVIAADVESERTFMPLMVDWKAPAQGISIGGAVLSRKDGNMVAEMNLCSYGEVTAFGIGNPSTPTSGIDGLLTSWEQTGETDTFALGAVLGRDLLRRFEYLSLRIDDIGTGGTDVTWSPSLTSGQLVGTLTIDGVQHKVYAPQQEEMALANLTGADNLKAIESLIGAGLLRRTGAGEWRIDTTAYLTSNQTITLMGDVTGSGSTVINTRIGSGKVTNDMLAGGISNGKLLNDSITIGRTRLQLGDTVNGLQFNNSGTLSWADTSGKVMPFVMLNSANAFIVGDSTYATGLQGSSLMLNGAGTLVLQRGGLAYISLVGDSVSVSKPIALGEEATRITFGDSSRYFEYGGMKMFHTSKGFYADGEVTAFGVGDVIENGPARSLGGLLNVDTHADDTPEDNSILIMASGEQTWRKVRIGDLFIYNMLERAEVETHAGVPSLKLTFGTGDVVYASLSEMNMAAFSEITERVGALEHSTGGFGADIESLKELTRETYYSETEWDVLTQGDTDYSMVPEGKIYIYEDEEEPGASAEYDSATGTLTIDGQYDSATGALTVDGSYDTVTGTLTI